MLRHFIVSALLIVVLSGTDPVYADESKDPVHNFEVLWKTINENYGNFPVKSVDWDALYSIYRPKVHADMSDEAFYELMCRMLDHLNDGHVGISNGKDWFSSGKRGLLDPEDFSLKCVEEKYLHGDFENDADNRFTIGKLTESIAYMHFTNFDNGKSSGEITDKLLALCDPCDGIVIDVRNNGGGSDYVGRIIAGRFADAKRPYLITRAKTGPGKDDFSEPRLFHIEAKGDKQFTGPVIVITNRSSASAAEVFSLGMRTLPHVTHIGTRTLGVFADARGDSLPNGWTIKYPFTYFNDHNDVSHEGIGVIPQIRVINTTEDLAANSDLPIELAIQLIQQSGK